MPDVLKGEAGPLFLLLYLLPGFLGAVMYYYLVEGEKPDNFERVIHALALTLASSLVVHGIFHFSLLPDITLTKDTSSLGVLNAVLGRSLLYITVMSVIIEVVFAILVNHDIILGFLRRLKITYKTSTVDVWQDTFYKYNGYWLRLRFSDGRSLIGWPQYYSPTGKPREIFIADATWWEPDQNGDLTSIDITGPGVYISDFSTVTAIELLD
jgi:hypothetical protein